MPNSACCSTKTRKKDTKHFVDRHRRVWATDVNLMMEGGGWEGAPGSASVPRQTLRVATTLDTIRFSLGLEEQRLLTRFTGYKPTSHSTRSEENSLLSSTQQPKARTAKISRWLNTGRACLLPSTAVEGTTLSKIY
jgi:hypothetical protein